MEIKKFLAILIWSVLMVCVLSETPVTMDIKNQNTHFKIGINQLK